MYAVVLTLSLYHLLHTHSLHSAAGEHISDRALLEKVEQHIFNVFRIKLAAMRLTKVNTFVASVSHDGDLKVG